jgi:hypothetical protein
MGVVGSGEGFEELVKVGASKGGLAEMEEGVVNQELKKW